MRSDVSSSVHGGAVAAKDEPRETLREAIEEVLRGAGPEGLTAKEIGAAVIHQKLWDLSGCEDPDQTVRDACEKHDLPYRLDRECEGGGGEEEKRGPAMVPKVAAKGLKEAILIVVKDAEPEGLTAKQIANAVMERKLWELEGLVKTPGDAVTCCCRNNKIHYKRVKPSASMQPATSSKTLREAIEVVLKEAGPQGLTPRQMVAAITAKKLWDFEGYASPAKTVRDCCRNNKIHYKRVRPSASMQPASSSKTLPEAIELVLKEAGPQGLTPRQMVAAITAKKLWDFSPYKHPEKTVRESCYSHNLPFNSEPHDQIQMAAARNSNAWRSYDLAEAIQRVLDAAGPEGLTVREILVALIKKKLWDFSAHKDPIQAVRAACKQKNLPVRRAISSDSKPIESTQNLAVPAGPMVPVPPSQQDPPGMPSTFETSEDSAGFKIPRLEFSQDISYAQTQDMDIMDDGDEGDHDCLLLPGQANQLGPSANSAAYDFETDWRGKALGLQQKVASLESVLDKMAPMLQVLREYDLNEAACAEISQASKSRSTRSKSKVDKNAIVEGLLGILHSSPARTRTPPEAWDEGQDVERDGHDEKFQALEGALWLLPSYWNTPVLAELSFVHLKSLAKEIVRALLERREDVALTDEKTSRMNPLILHLTGLVCSADPFENDSDNVQQIHMIKESCIDVLGALGRHPAINLQIIQSFVTQMLQKATAGLGDLPRPRHVFIEDFYWILHALEASLEKVSLDDPLTLSFWPMVQNVTESVIGIERVLLKPENALNRNVLFMGKWSEVVKKFSHFFLAEVQ
ncbi:hypothetical protein HKI87_10g61540 [Chloropicon roscoffensis]|uniref:HTH HARE-type domain-containing protein n=2 Tax=Chloropicon roscoffensis TaxID=1461544 RepID=A0AAX4PE15_9CHLO